MLELSSVTMQRKDTNFGMLIWVGLTSDQNAIPPQSRASALY